MIVSTIPDHPLIGLDTVETVLNLKPEEINTINNLILHKARTAPQTPLVAYPISDAPDSELAEHTAKDLDHFADVVAKELTRSGLRPTESRSDKSQVVAILGLSNLDYIVNILALTRMGFAILFLSTRLPIEAYISLLENTKCSDILVSKRYKRTIQQISELYPIHSFNLLEQSFYLNQTVLGPRFQRETDLINEENCVAFIIHSSGSTGLPKAISQKHRACLFNYAAGGGMRAFVTLPLFHNHGLSTLFRGIVAGKRTVLYNANLPLTMSSLVQAMQIAKPESFHGVPYALKVLAEAQQGIDELRKCDLVLFGGSSCPDELGDKLVNNGVYLVTHYGATELGQLMTSFRTPDDRNWSYMRPLPTTKPYLRFDAIGDGMFECVVLDGLPTKVVSNSDDPPNSFRTRDTFTPHPRIPGSWKYVGRLDDRITLENGEKVLPVPYEHFIRQSELVDDCLVFGIGRSFPGILVVKSDKTIGASNEQCLENLWPVIQTANSMTERFGQVSREMVAILDVDTDYPRTDKGTMIRAACYRKFEKVINTVYDRFDKADESINGGLAKLDLPGLQEFLFNLFNNVLGLKCLELETDFFDAGTDSLQSIAARGHIMRQIDLSGHILGQNVVFEHSSIQKLADHLYFLVTGSASGKKDEIEIMQDLIEKYSVFPEFYPGDNIPQEDVVVLTGATGSLGAHILSQLITLPNVAAVYCLVRAKSEEDANSRVLSALTSRKLDTLPHQDKIHAVPSDLSKSELGIPTSTFAYLQQNVTTVIHSAWAVNFNLGVASFESQHIRGTYNLLRLCQSVPFPRPANFAFISSISAAAGTSIPAVIEETYLADPTQAQNMGYARSKFVTEYVVRAAASTTPQHARVLRTGQIVGDTAQGLWNITEAIPLMIQSAVTMGVLPRLDETPSWLPVDKCAEAIIDLAEVRIPFSITLKSTPGGYCKEVVYHVQNPATLSWTEDLLPALSEAGLKFQTVSQQEWIAALRDGEQDPKRNPTVKLIDFFVEKYDNDRPGRRSLVFNTEKTAKKSKVIHDGIDVIGSGLVTKYVNAWNQVWYACDTNMR